MERPIGHYYIPASISFGIKILFALPAQVIVKRIVLQSEVIELIELVSKAFGRIALHGGLQCIVIVIRN